MQQCNLVVHTMTAYLDASASLGLPSVSGKRQHQNCHFSWEMGYEKQAITAFPVTFRRCDNF